MVSTSARRQKAGRSLALMLDVPVANATVALAGKYVVVFNATLVMLKVKALHASADPLAAAAWSENARGASARGRYDRMTRNYWRYTQ